MLDTSRVQELRASFLAGDYGKNILKKPSLLNFAGRQKLGTDGNWLLCDGKHTIAALKGLAEEHRLVLATMKTRAADAALEAPALEALAPEAQPDATGAKPDALGAHPWSDELVSVINDGIDVCVVEFDEDDPDLVLAYNAQAHDRKWSEEVVGKRRKRWEKVRSCREL